MTRRDDEQPSSSAVSDQAIEWVARLSRDNAGEADWLELQAWFDDDEERRSAFDAAQTLWLELDQHRTALALALSQTRSTENRPPRRRLRARRRAALWIGAAAAAAAAFVLVLLPLTRTPLQTNTPQAQAANFATAAGQRLTVRLSDGSRIDLDGASRLSVLYSKTARRVTMLQANAAFDVAKDPARPFVISVGESTVKVVGTAFDISRSIDETRVTVSRGVVQFDTPSSAGPPLRLTPGLSALHRDETAGVRVTRVASADATAWREGRLIYKDVPLRRVVEDLNREYSQPIRIGDLDVSRLRFTGVLVIGPEAAVVRRLTAFLPIRAETSDDGVVLRSTRP